MYSPVYALAVVGAWMMLRRPDTRWPALGLLATAGGFVLTVVPYYMWWGGWSVPARFLFPVLPVAAPMIAVAFGRCRGAASRGVSGLLLLASVVSFAVVIYQPQRRLLFNERDGSGRLVEAIQGGIDLTVVLPSFIEPDWVSQLPLVGGWLAAGAMACAAGSRRVTLRRAFWSGVLCLVGFVKAGSLVSGESLRRHNDRDVVSKGQQAAIAAFDGDRLSAYDYRDRRRLDLAHLFTRTTIVDQIPGIRPEPDPGLPQVIGGRVAGPYNLPVGRYRVRVWFDEDTARRPAKTDEVWVAFHRGPGILGRSRVTRGGPSEITLDLPVTFDPLWVVASSELVARAVTRVEIEPVSVVPRTSRTVIANIRQARVVADMPGRYAMYLDDNVYMEPAGFWVRGGRSASMHVTPNGASQLRVLLRNGAEAGQVTLEVDGRREVLELDRGEAHEVRLSLTGKELTVLLRFEPVNGFRPSERNPESRDTRWLGSHVRLSLD